MAVVTVSGAAEVTAAPARPRWYAHRFNRGAVYRAAALLAHVLPRPARLGTAAVVARLLAPRFRAERAVVRRNLARVVPSADAARLDRLVDDVFVNFARCFADLISSNRRGDTARLLTGVEGLEHLHAASSRRRGLVLVTAHLGNWELAGRMLSRHAARRTHVVVAEELDPGVERFLRGGPAPVRFVARRTPTAALPLIAALRRDEAVALQGDRALGNRGDVAVRFFGTDAAFPLGPFVLARAARAPALPAFCTLGGDGRYTVRVAPPIDVGVGGEQAALERWVAALEAVVRAHPEQWFNFYDVWSAAPAH